MAYDVTSIDHTSLDKLLNGMGNNPHQNEGGKTSQHPCLLISIY